ncbi:Gfo/Idh/MocA family protein [Roseofilum casamattae]|uniref:Gfo/Idh/MocA family oxidoreductase n=1 Tax=Roseofilum casamattae BLCC-M143 TaxID=3022442 RepID=A0ABT7BV07_9CYAN|nr:Gfo/Idh/MocA family oxidoreductase [Roseofilum casamattae]MDJ1183016.1 Gfo/Idh/MocA family oxidoreductase [Roseofilum casamattae BLCC-M143]
MNPDSLFRLAIVGLGRVTHYYWPALETIPGLTVVGVCDRDRRKVDGWNNYQSDCPAFVEIQELCKQVNPDAFVVATPSASHYTVMQELLPYGKPILLEKPATSSANDWEQLLAQIHRQKTNVIIAFHSAFSREVLWFREHQETWQDSLGNITGFSCGFYDPYASNGQLQPGAKSLVSSWIDSGVNALSTIAKFVRSLELIESHFTYNSDNIIWHSHSSFSFGINGNDFGGRGHIETHWGLGLNRKITHLYFAQTGHEIQLDHDRQCVRLIAPERQSKILADFAGEKSRLVAHYEGVFADFYRHLQRGTNNLDYAREIHQLLFAAYEKPYCLNPLTEKSEGLH